MGYLRRELSYENGMHFGEKCGHIAGCKKSFVGFKKVLTISVFVGNSLLVKKEETR